MTHSKACDSVPAGEPAYTRNGYRFYAQPDGTWLIVDGDGEDARRAATFDLATTSGRPSNIQLLGLYSTQRFQLEDLIETFAKHAAAGGERGG